ncbi:hypothetical protein Tco_1520607, partial [Tanacetum coccineum]
GGDGSDDDDEGSGDEVAVVVEVGMDVMILVVVAGYGCRRRGARRMEARGIGDRVDPVVKIIF